MGLGVRPSLRQLSVFVVTWYACTALGWGIFVWAVWRVPHWMGQVAWWPFATVGLLAVVSALLPVSPTALRGHPVYMWWSFVFAALYVWGLSPAVIITVGGVLVTQFARRKTADKWLFNTGMYVVCVTAAWLVLAAAGVAGSVVVAEVSVVTVAWMAASWVVFIVVNLCVVSGLSAWSGQTWWESFAEDVPAHVTSMLAGLCLSPLIAIVAVAGQYSWIALPFLLVPLFAVQKVADSSREQEHQALHDPLTGLPNRILLADRIEQSLARGARSEGRVVLLFVDLDRFKNVNDTLGHHAGDELLRSVAERLRSIVRPGDTLARYAGDEFIVLCDHMPGAEIEGLVDRISTRMREPHSHGGQEYVCTVSIGYAVADEDSDAQSLMTAADAAMYRAKSAGRDTAVRAE